MQVQDWEVIIPAGEVPLPTLEPAQRPESLEGKTVVLRWVGKNNGDVFLNRVAELFHEKHPSVKVVKSYELDPSLNIISGNIGESERITKAILGMKPDLVVGCQAD